MRLPTALCGRTHLQGRPRSSPCRPTRFRKPRRGRVAVVDDFLARDVVAALRGDAEELWDAGLYSVATRVLAATRPRRDPRDNAGADARHELKRRNERFVLRGSVARLRNRPRHRGRARPRRWIK